jgi:hypothetical protein
MKNEYRPFQTGDIVKIVSCKGRTPFPADDADIYYSGYGDKLYEVIEDENTQTGVVSIKEYSSKPDNSLFQIQHIHFFFLKLIVPAKKRVPYMVIDSPNTYNILDQRREGNGCIITLHKSEPSNTRELADQLCSNLNASVKEELITPKNIKDVRYNIVLNSENSSWEIKHSITGKVHALVFFGNDGYKIPKDTAETIISIVKDKMEAEWCPSAKSFNPPCADCKFWSEIYSHGSFDLGECSRGMNVRSCGYLGPFDICPKYECKNK